MAILNFNVFDEIVSSEFINSDDVLTCLKKILEPTDQSSRDDPSVVVKREKSNGRYQLSGRGLHEVFECDDPVSAACGVTSGIIGQYAKIVDDKLCLHAAVLIFQNKAFLIPSTYQAGKSYFCLAWLQNGERILTDDAALIDLNGFAVSTFGLPLCLRNQSLDHLTDHEKTFLFDRTVMTGKNLTYIKIDQDTNFSIGKTYPFGGWIFLSRKKESAPNIQKIAPDDALQKVIWQNFARIRSPSEIMSISAKLTSDYPAYLLEYAEARDAIPYLKKELEKATSHHVTSDGTRKLDFRIDQASGIAITLTENGAIVADDRRGRVYSFNQTAMQFWYLIIANTEIELAVDIFKEIYPEASHLSIQTDYLAFRDKLFGLDLIQPSLLKSEWLI